MKFLETIRVAITSLHANKLRSSLTVLGIVVGIFSIIVVSTVISMLQNSIEDGISFFGKNTFSIQKWPAVRTGGHGSMGKYRNRKNITLEEFYELKDKLVEAKAVSTQLDRGGLTAKYGNVKTNRNIRMTGTTPEGFITRDWNVEFGRAINQLDMNRGSNVVVLGKDLEAKLFKSINPLGREIWINNHKLRVIGILEKQGDIFGQSLDNYSIIPISTFNKLFGKRRRSVSISVMAFSKDDYDDLMMKTTGHLRTIRKVPPGEDNDAFLKCLTEKMFVYALGRPVVFGDRTLVRNIVGDLKQQPTLDTLIKAIVTSDAFQNKDQGRAAEKPPVVFKATETFLLWPGTPPGAREGDDAIASATAKAIKDGTYKIPDGDRRGIRVPAIDVYLPPKEKRTGTAMVIYCGGGYSEVCTELEGSRWPNGSTQTVSRCSW